MSSPTNRPGSSQRPRRDPNEVAAQLRNRDRSDIDARVRSHDRSAIDQHLKEREKNTASREKTLNPGPGTFAGARFW